MTDAEVRKALAAEGIVDDAAERFIVNLNREFGTALQLERARVDERVWKLEDELLQERTK